MTRMPTPPSERCAALAAELDLDVDTIGICHACLSFVSVPLADGHEEAARREARRMAPDLWEEGLAEPVLAALERARADGVPGAEGALLDVRARGPRSAVVRAIVLRLAADLAAEMEADVRLVTKARERRPLAPPELN